MSKIETAISQFSGWTSAGAEGPLPEGTLGLYDIAATGLADLGVMLPEIAGRPDGDWIARFFAALAMAAKVEAPSGASIKTREMARLTQEHARYHLGNVMRAAGDLPQVAAAWDGPARKALCLSFREFLSHLAQGFSSRGRVPHCGAAGRAILRGPANHEGPAPFVPTRPPYRYAGDNTAEVQLNFGLPVFVDTRDDSVAPDIIRTGWWEPWVDGVLRKSLGRGDVAVNVGANIGYYALLMAACVQDAGRVFAFEPNPRASELLGRSLTWGGLLGTTTLFPFAAGERRGAARFLVNGTFLGGGSFYEWSPDLAWLHLPAYTKLEAEEIQAVKAAFKLSAAPIEVHVATLDETVGRCVEEIHLLLMDAQQAECRVLEGAADLIERSRDLTIVMEWGYGPKLAPDPEIRKRAHAVIDRLADDGFAFWRIDGDTRDVYARPAILTPMSVADVMATDQFVDMFVRRRHCAP